MEKKYGGNKIQHWKTEDIGTVGNVGHTIHHHLDTAARGEALYPEAEFWRVVLGAIKSLRLQ